MTSLRVKHGHTYSILQYRVWAETIVGGRHASLKNPPRGLFFKTSKALPPDHSPSNSGMKPPAVIAPV